MAYIKFPHKVDRYKRTFVENNAGQEVPTFTFDQTLKVIYIPFYASGKIQPAIESISKVHAFFDKDAAIDYGDRFQNFIDKFGNVLDSGPYQVSTVQAYPGFSGSVRHFHCLLERIREV